MVLNFDSTTNTYRIRIEFTFLTIFASSTDTISIKEIGLKKDNSQQMAHDTIYYYSNNELHSIKSSSEITSILDAAHGGTGVSTLENGVLIGNGTNPIISIPKGANSTYFGINANGEYAWLTGGGGGGGDGRVYDINAVPNDTRTTGIQVQYADSTGLNPKTISLLPSYSSSSTWSKYLHISSSGVLEWAVAAGGELPDYSSYSNRFLKVNANHALVWAAIAASVSSTQTLEPGSSATASVDISNGNFRFTFGIPKGAKGNTGATGPQGPQGPAGRDGATLNVDTSTTTYTTQPGGNAAVKISSSGSTYSKTIGFTFWIPRGAQGPRGYEGPMGQQFHVIDYVASYEDLPENPNIGDTYAIIESGTVVLYTYSSYGDWLNLGPAVPGPMGPTGRAFYVDAVVHEVPVASGSYQGYAVYIDNDQLPEHGHVYEWNGTE